MSKERLSLKDNSHCPPSSKNAKDESSSTAMLALRGSKGAEGSRRNGSCCSSEKDSGFSDGSDWQQTDIEDQRSHRSHFKDTEHASPSPSGQNCALTHRTTENPSSVSAKLQQPHIYIMKDVMLMKQPSMSQKGSQLLLCNGSTISSHAASPHMVIFDQPSLIHTNVQLKTPRGVGGKKSSSAYQPLLKSYPRIAPHPSKKPPERSSHTQDSQTLSKRVCTEAKRVEVPLSVTEEAHQHQPKAAAADSVLLCPTASSSRLLPSSAASLCAGLHTSAAASRGRSRSKSTSTRCRRFLNTVELLRQSGLLDVTLRTKELQRQSSATERDICQLRQHTELLRRAASSCSPNRSAAWDHLRRAMAESGSYPDLALPEKSQDRPPLDSVRKPPGDTNGPQGSERPGQFYSSSSRARREHGRPERERGSTEHMTFVSPDSSTG